MNHTKLALIVALVVSGCAANTAPEDGSAQELSSSGAQENISFSCGDVLDDQSNYDLYMELCSQPGMEHRCDVVWDRIGVQCEENPQARWQLDFWCNDECKGNSSCATYFNFGCDLPETQTDTDTDTENDDDYEV